MYLADNLYMKNIVIILSFLLKVTKKATYSRRTEIGCLLFVTAYGSDVTDLQLKKKSN